jgi:CRP-like cAMP-binding protein
MKISRFFADTFLFSGIDEATIDSLVSEKVTKKRFLKNELICSPESCDKKIGFVLSGECEICSDNSRVPLNRLGKYSVFGVTNLFSSEDDFPTNIYAAKECEVLFIEKDDFLEIIKSSPEASFNLIRFLVGRISFLNKKISSFSSENTETKLMKYLLTKYRQHGVSFELNLSRTAEEINSGRASLYRSLNALESEGVISRVGKSIRINNPKGLERK